MSYLLKFIVVLSVASLSGCSWIALPGFNEDYGCKGMPTDPVCLSAMQVYEATNHVSLDKSVNVNVDEDEEIDEDNLTPEQRLYRNLGSSKGYKFTKNNGMVSGGAVRRPTPRIRGPLPLRTQAKVMRIWVAPWEDIDGDLNVPGYLYTEIESRRWTIGEQAPEEKASFNPLEIR